MSKFKVDDIVSINTSPELANDFMQIGIPPLDAFCFNKYENKLRVTEIIAGRIYCRFLDYLDNHDDDASERRYEWYFNSKMLLPFEKRKLTGKRL